jgi:hypothetical protein
LMELIKKGAFLTVKADGIINTTTIGWATIGYIWQDCMVPEAAVII